MGENIITQIISVHQILFLEEKKYFSQHTIRQTITENPLD